jgi:hypothetical protein
MLYYANVTHRSTPLQRNTTMHKLALIASILTIGIASAFALTTVQAQNYNVVGLIWEDTNCNGIQDAGEDGLAGIRVALIQQGTDTQVYTADDRLLEYSTGNGGTAELPKGTILFTRGSRLLAENYYLAIFNADKPAGYVLAPVQAGSDRSIDNDLTKPLADSPLWATVPFLLTNGQVTNIDIGLCRDGTQQPITYDNHLFLPLIVN